MSEWTSGDITGLSVENVTDAESATIKNLLKVWTDRRTKNLKRTIYADGEQAFKDLGLTLPPQLKAAKFYLGWGTQAVRKPAIRSQFRGLRLPGSDDPFELGEILEANNFALELGQGIQSAYKHGPAFVTVAKGDVGESPVQFQTHSAESSAAIWDRRARRIGSLLTISDMKEDKPTEFIVYLPTVILLCQRTDAGRWFAERIPNAIGRTLAVPLTYDPQLNKPFGRSRLSQAIMSLCDMGVRAYVRMEGNAEAYSWPQIAVEGIDPDAFGELSETRKFKLAMDRLIALSRDADGNVPNIKQLQQATMAPHSEMIRTVASAFSGETGISLAELGILHDNPASADAMFMAERGLLLDVKYQNSVVFNSAVKSIATLGVMVRDGLTEPPAEAWKLSAVFADPEFRSYSAKADAYTKFAAADPELGKSSVLLETIFDHDQVDRIQADRTRSQAGGLLSQLIGNQTAPPVTPVVTEGV